MGKEMDPRAIHEKRQGILVDLVKKGRLDDPPEGISRSSWERKVNMGIAYELGSSTYEEIGKSYDVSRQAVHLNTQRFLTRAWKRSKREENGLTEEEFFISKPSPEKVQQVSEITDLRRKIRDFENEKDRSLALDLFRALPSSSVHSLYIRYRKTGRLDKCPVSRFRDMLRGRFYYKNENLRIFSEVLQDNGFPVRKYTFKSKKGDFNYYYVLKSQKKQMLEVLRSEPSVTRFKKKPVVRICGEGEVPTTTEIIKGRGYVSVHAALKKQGERVSPWRLLEFKRNLLERCPVAIFDHRGSYYIKQSDEESLLKHLQSM
jgi:hypothetical protein